MRHHRRVESRATQPSPSIVATGRYGPLGAELLFGRWPVAEHHILRLRLAWAGLSAGMLPVALAGIAVTAAALVSAGLVLAALILRQRSAPTEHVPRSAA